jgi:hypothetical protein
VQAIRAAGDAGDDQRRDEQEQQCRNDQHQVGVQLDPVDTAEDDGNEGDGLPEDVERQEERQVGVASDEAQ